MSDTNNMDMFNEYTAKVFAELYQTFPEVRSLDVGRMSGCKPDDYGVIGKRGQVCAATIEWLSESGYIRLGQRMDWFFPAVLTAKGLEVLKATPASLTQSKSAGDSIVDAVKEGAIRTAVNLVSSALTEGFKLLGQ